MRNLVAAVCGCIVFTLAGSAITVTAARGAPIEFIPNTGRTFSFDNSVGGSNVSHFSANVSTSPEFTSMILQALPPGPLTLTVGSYTKFRLFTAPGLDLGLATGGSVVQISNIPYN